MGRSKDNGISFNLILNEAHGELVSQYQSFLMMDSCSTRELVSSAMRRHCFLPKQDRQWLMYDSDASLSEYVMLQLLITNRLYFSFLDYYVKI
jgi:hypothetical protein